MSEEKEIVIELPPEGLFIRYLLSIATMYLAWYADGYVILSQERQQRLYFRIKVPHIKYLVRGLEMLVKDCRRGMYGLAPYVHPLTDGQRIPRTGTTGKILQPLTAKSSASADKWSKALGNYIDYVWGICDKYAEILSNALGHFYVVSSRGRSECGYINDEGPLLTMLSFMQPEFLEAFRVYGLPEPWSGSSCKRPARNVKVGLHTVCIASIGAWLSRVVSDRATGLTLYIMPDPEKFREASVRILEAFSYSILNRFCETHRRAVSLLKGREWSLIQAILYLFLELPDSNNMIIIQSLEGGPRCELTTVKPLDLKACITFVDFLKMESMRTIQKLSSLVKDRDLGPRVANLLYEAISSAASGEVKRSLIYEIARICNSKYISSGDVYALTNRDIKLILESLDYVRTLIGVSS